MSALLDTKKESHRAQQSAGAGAGITLVCGCGEYVASFDCASRCAELLGKRELRDMGDGIFESIPVYKIPLEEINGALLKLSARYSVALVDLACEKGSSRFVLVWKILPSASAASAIPAKPSMDINDY